MSIRLMTYALDSKLPSNEKLVMTIFCDYANDEGKSCYPSKENVARRASMSTRNVQRVTKILEERGLLNATEFTSGGRNTVHYEINTDALKRGEGCKDRGDKLSPQLIHRGDVDVTPNNGWGDTGVTAGVTPMVNWGDTSVTQVVSKPSKEPLSGSGSVRQTNSDGLDPDDVSPPPLFFEKKEEARQEGVSENVQSAKNAQSLIQSHHALEREFFGIHPDKQPITELDTALAESWLSQGIAYDFCVKTFKSRMSDRKIRGKGAVFNFRYWKDVIPDQWRKSGDSQTKNPITAAASPPAPRREFDAATSNVQCSAAELQAHLRGVVKLPPEHWQEHCRTQLAALREHPAWVAVLERMEGRMGKAWCDNWLRVCSPVVITAQAVILWCPTPLTQAEVGGQRKWDIHASFQQQLGDTVKLILTT
jgi:hypothetical protein